MPPEMPSPEDSGPLHPGGGLIKGRLGLILIGAVGGAVLVGFLIYNFKPEWFGIPTATPGRTVTEPPTEVACVCQGTTLICGDVVTLDSPQCGGDVVTAPPPPATEPPSTELPTELPCVCQGFNLICPGQPTSYNSSQCGGSNTCICIGTTLACPDGTYAEFNPACGVGGGQCNNSTCGDGKCNAACGEDINTCPVDCHL